MYLRVLVRLCFTRTQQNEKAILDGPKDAPKQRPMCFAICMRVWSVIRDKLLQTKEECLVPVHEQEISIITIDEPNSVVSFFHAIHSMPIINHACPWTGKCIKHTLIC